MWDLFLAEECRGRKMLMPLTPTGKYNLDLRRQGALEVLELILGHDEEDDVFVGMMAWGTLILALVIWCLKNYDVVETAL